MANGEKTQEAIVKSKKGFKNYMAKTGGNIAKGYRLGKKVLTISLAVVVLGLTLVGGYALSQPQMRWALLNSNKTDAAMQIDLEYQRNFSFPK